MENERLLTTPEVAEYLGVPVSTMYLWRQKGTAPKCYRVGKYMRYRREDVDAWLAERTDQESA